MKDKHVKTEQLISEVTSLPVGERVVVVDHLLRSLNPPESSIDMEWAAVAQKRLAEIESDRSKAIPGEEVFAKIAKRFAQ